MTSCEYRELVSCADSLFTYAHAEMTNDGAKLTMTRDLPAGDSQIFVEVEFEGWVETHDPETGIADSHITDFRIISAEIDRPDPEFNEDITNALTIILNSLINKQ